MKSIRVATDPPYDVRVGRGLLGEISAATVRFSSRAVLSDDIVAPLWLERIPGLEDAPCLAVPAGEVSKSLATIERALEFMAEAGLDRGSCLVALGGGVVGDLGGLAASLYMRGIAIVHVPTTLLAQVDASVGGKTAVDLAAGKNLAGTFHQPAVVIADIDTLATLPDAEYRSGLGEVVKSALIEGEEALARLEREAGRLVERDPGLLEEVVAACVRTKAAIVARDPEERGGERKVLNLGHTFAHAIERAAGYGSVRHGEAVSVGLALAARLAREAGILEDPALPERVERLLRALGLPAGPGELHPGLEPDAVLAGMAHDKKGAARRPRFVLPAAAGRIRTDIEVELRVVSRLLARAPSDTR